MSHAVSLYQSISIHLSFILVCDLYNPGYYKKGGKPAPFVSEEYSIQQQWNGIFSLFWEQKECLIPCNFLLAYLDLHWLLQLALLVCGVWFFWCKIWSLLWFFITLVTLKSFLFSSQCLFWGFVILCSFLQCSRLFSSAPFSYLPHVLHFTLLFDSYFNFYSDSHVDRFFFKYANILPQLQKTVEKVGFSSSLLLNPTDVIHSIAAVSRCPSRSFFFFFWLCYTGILLMIIRAPVLMSYWFPMNINSKLFGFSE